MTADDRLLESTIVSSRVFSVSSQALRNMVPRIQHVQANGIALSHVSTPLISVIETISKTRVDANSAAHLSPAAKPQNG